MIFNDVVELYNQLQEVIKPLDNIRNMFLDIHEQYLTLGTSIISKNASEDVNTNTWLRYRSDIKNHLWRIQKSVQKINWMPVGKISLKLEQLIDVNNDLYQPARILIIMMEKCSNIFFEYCNIEDIEELSDKSKLLIAIIEDTVKAIDNIKLISEFLIQTSVAIQPNYNEDTLLSIRLYDETLTVKDINNHISIMSDIYERACTMFNVSTIDYPLIPIKIETGSLLNKMLGHEKVLKFLEDVFNKSIGFIYRNYTREGKLSESPKKIEALKEHIKLIELCEEHGIDMTQAKDTIEQNVNVLCNDLYRITANIPKIAINERVYDVGKEATKALIEERSVKYLNYKTQNEVAVTNPE